MPSGFMPVITDLRPSVKVTIPWDKPKGIRCMPSGFTPVVIDLHLSVKVTIPSGKPVQCLIFTHISGHRKPRCVVFRARAQSEGRYSCKKEVGKDDASCPWIHERDARATDGKRWTVRPSFTLFEVALFDLGAKPRSFT